MRYFVLREVIEKKDSWNPYCGTFEIYFFPDHAEPDQTVYAGAELVEVFLNWERK